MARLSIGWNRSATNNTRADRGGRSFQPFMQRRVCDVRKKVVTRDDSSIATEWNMEHPLGKALAEGIWQRLKSDF